MTRWTRITLNGAVAVVAFDTLASLVTRVTGVAYGWAIIGSCIIHISVGYLAARTATTASVRMAALAGLALGLVDTTAGWATSWLIGPGRVEGFTVAKWVATAMFVASVSAGIAALGGVLGRPTNQRTV